MSAHTPGPWRVSKRDASFVERDIDSTATVAKCHDPSRANADASLIAIAPEMYDTLRAMVVSYARLYEAGECGLDDCMESARALLARIQEAKTA